MIVIFGNKVRYKTISTGQFSCPQCRTQRTYELRQARNWFALYFIPIIPLNTIGEFVTCLTCGTQFAQEVLSMPMPSNTPLDRLAREARGDLDSGTPIEMARQKLINTGLNRDLVEQVIRQAAGPDRKHCPVDHLTYRTTIQRCAQCGAWLENSPRI
ncbi:MAG TPA: zinc-ribbon domain-containing protein [Anaerolineae bacterium]|nr:zinc-ribbon domain-containing protein [Anaerolineae bacterium]